MYCRSWLYTSWYSRNPQARAGVPENNRTTEGENGIPTVDAYELTKAEYER